MVKCYKTKNLDSYYLEMWATEWFLKWEIKTLVDKLRDKEEEIKKLKEYNWELIEKHKKDIAILCEENKSLKKELEQTIYWKVDYEKAYKQADAKKEELLEENEKLNAENRKLKKYYDRDKEELMESCYDLARENENLNARIKELEQCNLNLQTWLDNKEKVNKSLREENKRLSDFLECDWE